MEEQEFHMFPDGNLHAFPKGTPPETIKKAITDSSVPSTPREAASSLHLSPVPIVSSLAGAGVGVLTKSPFLGSAAAASVDKFLRYATGEEHYDNPLNTGLDIAGNTVLNEVGGRLLSVPFKISNAIRNAGAPDLGSILDLKPTYTQLLRSTGSKFSGLAQGFENLFAPTSKTKALETSFEAAKDEGDRFIQDLTGTRSIKLDTPNLLANKIKEGEQSQFFKLKIESNARGEAAKFIADANPQPRSNGKIVNGPITYTETIRMVNRLKKEIKSSSMKPDPDNPVLKALDDILDATNATFDKSGTLVDSNPVSFATAWKDKQIADGIGYGGTLTDLNIQDSRFRGIANAINQDIENSIPKWTVDGDKALQLFQEAKFIVSKRNTLFNPTNESGKSIDTLLNSVTTPTKTLDTIMDDPEKVKRLFLTGNIVIPDTAGPSSTNLKYITNNARKDAQGYQMMRMLNEATIANPLDNTKQVFDGTKLMTIVNDPNKQEAFKIIYGSEGLSNVKQLARNIAMVSQKGEGMGASRYLGLKLGTYGISLGAGVATALTAGKLTSGLTGGALGLGVTVGAHGLAKLMTNPSTARIMLNMSQSAPLGMSVQLATRMIANTLRGQPITVNYSDGNSVDGKIDATGKFGIPIER